MSKGVRAALEPAIKGSKDIEWLRTASTGSSAPAASRV